MKLKNQKQVLFWGFLIAFSSIIFFKIDFYRFLIKISGLAGWAYVIDKGIYVILGAILFFYFFRKKISLLNLLDKIKPHLFHTLILLVTILVVHGILLKTYFYAEDSAFIYRTVTQNSALPDNHANYPFLPPILLNLLFGPNVLPYNIATIFLFSATIVLAYWFLFLLSKNKFVSFASSLFFATSSSYLNMFPWHTTAQGIPFAIILSLISLIFLVYFLRSPSVPFYVTSLLFFVASTDAGFVRSAGMISIFLFLLLLPSHINKIKSKLYSLFLCIPYFLIWFSFLVINFARQEAGLINESSKFDIGNYFTAISYYMSSLFIPAFWAKPVFSYLDFFLKGEISIAVVLGYFFSILLLIILVVSFIRRKILANWLIVLGIILIFTNIFYVPIFQDFSKDISKLDLIFSKTSPPYGPGSRYLFPSSLGVGVLFAVFIWWLGKKNKLLNILSMTVLIITISINGYLSLKSHRDFINGEIRLTKALVENVFSMVPRDGRPKLLFSTNSLYKNQIDVNHGGGEWLYGFYKKKELIYTRDLSEIKKLLTANNYKKESFYSFYNNPETGSFADNSSYFRDIFFNKNHINEKILVEFSNSNREIKTVFTPLKDEKKVFLSERPVVNSREVNKRIVLPKTLAMNIKISPIDSPSVFSDAVIAKKQRPTPLFLWENISENKPLMMGHEDYNSSNIKGELSDNFTIEEKNKIVDTLKQRKILRNNTQVSISDLYDLDDRASKESLIDGVFNSDPLPSKTDKFYLAKTMPAEIDFKLPYPIVPGRLLLNTVKSFSDEHSPTEGTVFVSLGNNSYEEVGSIDNLGSKWSPNGGKMIEIPLKPVLTDSIRLIVNKTKGGKPVSFDEIIIDDINSLDYSPEQIYNYANQAFWYVDSRDILESLLTVKSYYKLNLVYACAEDKDWENQNKHPESLVPEVWNIETLSFDLLSEWTNTSTPIDCYGSMLRKIFIIGPPFPARLQIRDAIIN